MNYQNLTPGKYANLRQKIGNAYETIAGSTDYKRNDNNLRVIQVAVVIVVMIS